jgi:hypothetical protein
LAFAMGATRPIARADLAPGIAIDGPTVTIDRAAELLYCSRARAWQLLAQGVITRAPRYGRRTVVTTESVHAAALGVTEAPPTPRPRRRRGSVHLAEELRAAVSRATSSGTGSDG